MGNRSYNINCFARFCGDTLGSNKRVTVNSTANDYDAVHEGVKTVGTSNPCSFPGEDGLCIRIVSWNMNGQVSYDDLVELIGRDRKFDLLVLGLQEVPRNNIPKLLLTALTETHMMVGKAVMQSLQLYIFGPKDSEMFIKELKVDKHSFGGCGGLIRRKKGAVGIRINYNGLVLSFISCHLAAHARNVEERNAQFRHISQFLFSSGEVPHDRPPDVTVWLGDLNYRLQGINTHPARKLIQKDLHTELLTSKDQLLQEAERGQIFDKYCEGTLTFRPTYKYDTGSDNYDTSHKVRVPSWTDRILFKVEEPDRIEASLQSYTAIDEIHSSDHKPVKAHLCLNVKDR